VSPPISGGGDDAVGDGHAEGVRGMVHVAERASGLHADCPSLGIDADPPQAREVDDQPVVADAESARIVATAANRHWHPGLSAEADGRHHVGHVRAPQYETGPPVDHGVVDLPCRVVPGVAGLDQFAPQRPLELFDALSGHRALPSHMHQLDPRL